MIELGTLITKMSDEMEVKVKRSASEASGGEVRKAVESAQDEGACTRYRVVPSPANNRLKPTASQQAFCSQSPHAAA